MINKFCLLPLVVTLGFTALANPPLKTVPNLDLNRYVDGDWYQVAAIPAWFQKQCYSRTKAQYINEGKTITVINTCYTKKGKKKTAEGQARPKKDFNDPARLEVTFVSVLSHWIWWLVAGDYWVMNIGKNYEYSVVGDPKRKYLWILSRTEQMSEQTLAFLEEKIRNQGYDTCKVKITQEGPLKGRELCKLKPVTF